MRSDAACQMSPYGFHNVVLRPARRPCCSVLASMHGSSSGDGYARRGRRCRAGWGCIGSCFGSRTMTTPTAPPNAVRILSALELRPHTWTRTGPRSIEHAGLAVRLTLGIVTVRIAHIVADGDPVPIPAAPATRNRIAELLEDRLRRATGADLDPDAIAWGSGDIG